MIDQPSAPTTALAVRPTMAPLMRPVAPAKEILQAQNETRAVIAETLQKDRDFGIIPGTDKQTLLKPGAERVAMAFGCAARFTIAEKEIDHERRIPWLKTKWVEESPRPANWQELKAAGVGRNKKYSNPGGDKWVWQRRTEEEGVSLGLYRYVVNCELVHRESGTIVGQAVGSCSTLESKYIDRPRDAENTILKMAQKRAFVGATLVAFGLSDQFTQDIEDAVVDEVPLAHPPADADGVSTDPADQADDRRANTANPPAAGGPEPSCPKCGSLMWDNRISKKTPKAPDYKCRSRSCDGVLWPGQWPPAPPMSEAQRAQIVALMGTAKPGKGGLTDAQRAKINAKLFDAAEPLNQKKADELIQALKGKQPTASEAAADELQQRQVAAATDPNADHNTITSDNRPLSELPF